MTSRFLFFGGKGGVGKTTCAAARGVAEAGAGRRVLIVSTDPAHSLGDALDVRLSSRVSAVPVGRRSLRAVELDAPRAFARWLGDHGQALGDIIEHGTWLDREDVDALLGLAIPGIDELVGMLEIVRLAASDRAAYDIVIVDTAPTGHALRLLASPQTVASVADALEALQHQHRVIREQLARVGRPEAADRLIALLAEQAHETGRLLRDRQRSAFYWVMLPEMLSLAESVDGINALDRAEIPVAEIIVNRVLPDGPPCPICDRRRREETRWLAAARRRFGRPRSIRSLPAELREPRGVSALGRLGRRLIGDRRADLQVRRSRTAGLAARATPAYSSPDSAPTTPPESIAALRGARLLFVGGKGGVGKTTVAATVAVRLAHAEPEQRLLLISIDPAHSLGDVLGAAVGDRPATIGAARANLHVRELDAPRALAARRAALEAALTEIAATFGAGQLDVTGGRGVGELLDLAPPGIDELLGVLSVVEAEHVYDTIVVDTAPTGHALRFLEMPDAAREWVQVLLRVLLKYRDLVRPGQLATELVALSKSIRRLLALLRNPRDSRFIVVTRAADVPRLETERLLERLRRLKLAAPVVVVNAATLAPRSCPRCRATAAAERPVIAALRGRCRRRSHECAIILTPMAAPPPRGVAALDRWAQRWIVDEVKS